jgi:hypothetical protein
VTGKELCELAEKIGILTESEIMGRLSESEMKRWDELAAKVVPVEHDSCPVLRRAEAAFKEQMDSLLRGKGDINVALNAYVTSPHIAGGRPDLAMRAAFKAGLGAETNAIVFDHPRRNLPGPGRR